MAPERFFVAVFFLATFLLVVFLAVPVVKSNPDIFVVQPAENWAAKNVPGPLDGARDRRILFQG